MTTFYNQTALKQFQNNILVYNYDKLPLAYSQARLYFYINIISCINSFAKIFLSYPIQCHEGLILEPCLSLLMGLSMSMEEMASIHILSLCHRLMIDGR